MAQGFWDTRGIASDGEGRLRLGLPWSAQRAPEPYVRGQGKWF